MREAEKKRLVRLIEEAHKKSAEAIHEHIMDTLKTKGRFNSKTDGDRQSIYEIEADHLLDNGIIVPPCKVGDTVYVIDDWGYKKELKEREVGVIVIKGTNDFSKELWEELWEDAYDGDIGTFAEVGKTVFLSKAEAEYALKNRRSVSLVDGHIEE